MTEPAPTVSLATLNTLAADDFVQRLGNIYEHAPWVAANAATARPFATVATLFEALKSAVRQAAPAERTALIRGHPDLAGKAARAGALTAESSGEQTSAGLDVLSEAEFAAFHRLNDAYRAKFGFPFIICVRRYTTASILTNFEHRLGRTQEAEQATALAEIDRIAALRLDSLVTGGGRLNVVGRLSTHVLDAHAGIPAAGIAVALRELAASGDHRLVASAVTDADGRTAEPLIADRPVPIGRYELAFAIGDYFARRGVGLADPPFLDVVPIRFAVAEAEGHYHIPLLATPWFYSTYRGS